MAHKAGFVNILGNPNVGKSTLMNLLVGERLSIITSKAQTTRHRIPGIVNGADYQIVFSDTPGILKPNYKLQESMMKFVSGAFEDADIILYITDVVETFDKNADFLDRLKNVDIPVIILINKIDLTNTEKLNTLAELWHETLPKAEILPISAISAFNTDRIIPRIVELLPDGPPFYPPDALTDKPERFFVSEIIREKILLYYKKEIPYSVEVEIESFKEEEKIIRISAIIYVMRDSQKGILIGHKGSALKKTGTEARKALEKFFEKKIFLELFVKVNKNWRESDRQLKRFGY
ncbi:MAG TPA: GTPase Era [Bacteroidales bacterium]|nr:GTPase Era [Bacteroidales bacterium]